MIWFLGKTFIFRYKRKSLLRNYFLLMFKQYFMLFEQKAIVRIYRIEFYQLHNLG
jgi:hypothetical protein